MSLGAAYGNSELVGDFYIVEGYGVSLTLTQNADDEALWQSASQNTSQPSSGNILHILTADDTKVWPLSRYIQIGKLRHYELSFLIDTDSKIRFSVNDSIEVFNLTVDSKDINQGPYSRAVDFNRSHADDSFQLEFSREADNNADMYVKLGFTAIMR